MSKAGAKIRRRRPRRYPLWWREALKRFAACPPPIKHRVPPTWDELPDEAKIDFYHDALLVLGPVHTFTCRLRHDVEVDARSRPNATEWLRRRIARELKNEFDRPVHVVMAWEQDANGALHGHGEIGVNSNEIERARAALRRACGEWRKNRQRQVQSHGFAPDHGWSSYIGKQITVTGALRRAGSRCAPSYGGASVSVSREIGQAARALLEKQRWALLRSSCTPLVPR